MNLFVIKRVQQKTSRKTGQPYTLVGFYNSSLGIFGAECFASAFSLEEAQKLKEKLFVSSLEIVPANPEIKPVVPPADAPQFTDDPLLRG